MPIFSINGISYDLNSDAQERPEVLEDVARSAGGTLLRTRIAVKASLELKTTPMSRAAAVELVKLLEGRGDHWPFDESGSDVGWSEGGLGVASGSPTRVTSAPSPRYGAGCVQIGAGARVGWSAGATGDWTLMAWRWSGSAWEHYALTSGGAKYKDGASYGGSIPFLAVSAGIVYLGDTGAGAAQYFDDLVLLLWEASAELIAGAAAATVPFRLPNLSVDGDLIDGGPLQMGAEDVDVEFLPHVVSGALDPLGSLVSFRLREV